MPVEVADKVYWVGAIDWNVRNFHGYTYATPRGTTYNAYLVLADEPALVDTVARGFEEEMMARIREVIDPARIRHLIANHGEPDHSAAIPYVLAHAPHARLYCTRKGTESLGAYYPELGDFQVVATGDTLALGGKTLQFIEAPMLHWPDSMFTYVQEDRLLLPNDAFGQHLATSQRFDDQVEAWQLWDEAARYYANILTPFSRMVLRKLDELAKSGLAIDTVAPSHGVIWRKDPLQIVHKYAEWAQQIPQKSAVILYDTMWNATRLMAEAIGDGLAAEGVPYKLLHAAVSDRNDVITEIFKAKAIVIGSPTLNRGPLPTITPILEDLKGLRFKNKIGAAFGSYGWSGEAVKLLEQHLNACQIPVVAPGVLAKWQPTAEDLARCRQLGQQVAHAILGS